MSNQLLDMQEKFGTSRPVFLGVKNPHSGEIEFSCSDPYDPVSVDLDKTDPVVTLMINNYSEQFDPQDKVYTKLDRREGVLRDMHVNLKSALINALPLKNPQQSKLYKWYGSHFEHMVNVQDGFIALYRYVASHTDSKFRFNEDSENPHAKNLVAIIEKMKEKYERR
jgi:hypothetical protein